MTGPGGQRLRTRSGEQVKLASLIDEAVERAATVIADRYDDPAERSRIAEAVGIGALKYGDLSVARDSAYVLDFDRLLALTGNTGPYLQYAAARIRSIFVRGGLDPAAASGPIVLGTAAERGLALRLLGFSRALDDVAAAAEPHKLASFLFDLASSFTTFYEQCPVLTAEGDARREPAGAERADPPGAGRWPRAAGHPRTRADVARQRTQPPADADAAPSRRSPADAAQPTQRRAPS